MTFFQITEEDTDPVASGSSNQLDQESGCGFIETAPAKKKKKCDSAVDEACGLLRAVKTIWRICGEESSRSEFSPTAIHRPAQNTHYTVGSGDGVT